MSMFNPTLEQIEAGAAALRASKMKGKITRQWVHLPHSTKRKWIEQSEIVLRAAYNANYLQRNTAP